MLQEMPKKSLLDRMIEQLEADDAEQTDSEVGGFGLHIPSQV